MNVTFMAHSMYGPLSTCVNSLDRRYKHGHAKRNKPTATYKAWRGMHDRCNDLADQDYGGRGITVCARWNDFMNFLADMGERPNKLTLDRLDTNGNYEPGNCRWATRTVQQRNRRITRAITINGERKLLAELAAETGIPYATLWNRIEAGWTPEQVISIT